MIRNQLEPSVYAYFPNDLVIKIINRPYVI